MKVKTPIKSIREKCIDCSGGSKQEVKLCPIKDCPLYPYRMGKNPNIKKRKLTEEQKVLYKKRMLKAREARVVTEV